MPKTMQFGGILPKPRRVKDLAKGMTLYRFAGNEHAVTLESAEVAKVCSPCVHWLIDGDILIENGNCGPSAFYDSPKEALAAFSWWECYGVTQGLNVFPSSLRDHDPILHAIRMWHAIAAYRKFQDSE